MPRQIELRFSARNLANKDFLSLSDPFLVCHVLQDGAATERIGRTETVKDDLNPTWTTTISFAHTRATESSTLLVDIFDRDSPSDDRLTKHDFLGRAILPLRDLLSAPDMRLDIPLASATHRPLKSVSRVGLFEYPPSAPTESTLPGSWSALTASTDEDDLLLPRPVAPDLTRATTTARASKGVRGSLSVFAEHLSPERGVPIVFRVASALLRDANPLGRRVTQFYELQRERHTQDGIVWSCVYRSKDGINVDRNNYVVFDEMSVTEQQLHNMEPSRRLRLAFYKRHTRSQHVLISYVITTVEDVLATRGHEREATLPLEGEFGDDDGLGNVIVKHVERVRGEPEDGNDEGGEIHIHLRADHFLHKRFVSSLNDGPKHVRRLRQLPSFITLH